MVKKGNIMPNDKSKLQSCSHCNNTIEPKYLGKDREGNHAYWYEGNNALPILTVGVVIHVIKLWLLIVSLQFKFINGRESNEYINQH